jgi:HAD superfamily hydrolase (TIGR01450 family)
VTAARPTAVVDLDGVVWLAGEPLPGVGRAIELLRRAGHEVLFATNNSSPTLAELLTRLERAGVEAEAEQLITAAQAAVAAVEQGSSALLIGEAGLEEAAAARGLTNAGTPSSVLVGWRRTFDFNTVATASSAVRAGARLIATNDDPTHPTPDGLLPGTGALVAAIATASEQRPLIAGKPGAHMVGLVHERAERISIVIGDRPSTDGAFAAALDAPFGLVRSQATPGQAVSADLQADSLLGVVERFVDQGIR